MGNQKSASLPYTIGEEVKEWNDFTRSGWKLYDGIKKDTKDRVSIFKFERKQQVNSYNKDILWDMALNHFRTTKTTRHPYVLTYIDGIETNNMLIIVTEKVVPLLAFVKGELSSVSKTSTKNMVIAWGCHCLLKAIMFVNNECNWLHGGIASKSVFVSLSGDFKLSGFHVTAQPDTIRKSPGRLFCEGSEIIHGNYRSPERKENNFTEMFENPAAVDIYGFACILLDCFATNEIPQYSSQSVNILPTVLRKIFLKMIASEPKKRPTCKAIYESQGFSRAFNNKYVKALIFLEEIHIKSMIEKLEFMKNLVVDVEDFPQETLFYKLIPALTSIQELNSIRKIQEEGSYQHSLSSLMLQTAFKIVKRVTMTPEKQNLLLPLVLSMFKDNNRQTRVTLLENLELYIEFIDRKVLNQKVFPNILVGFTDNTVTLREATLKSMVVLAPRLSEANLNDVLVKAMIKVLDDSNGSLVTNVVVCFSKLLVFFNSRTKLKIIAAVYPKGLKSPHEHTRVAALKGIQAATSELISDNEGSLDNKELENAKLFISKLIPAASFSLLDSSSVVRAEAFRTFEILLKRIRSVANKMDSTKGKEGTDTKSKSYFTSMSRFTSYISQETSEEISTKSFQKEELRKELFDDANEPQIKETNVDMFDIGGNNDVPDATVLRKSSKKTSEQLAKEIIEEDDFFKNF